MLIYYVDLKPLGLIGLSFIVLLFPPRPLIFSPRKIKKFTRGRKKEKKKYFQELKSTNRAIDLIRDIIIIITIIIIKISFAMKNFLEDEA